MSVKTKAEKFIKESKGFILATVDERGMPQTRMMGSQILDEKFVVYSSCFSNSRKVKQINKHPKCQLFFINHKAMIWMTLSGTAKMVEDQKCKTALYKKFKHIDEYFKGPEDKNYAVIKFKTKKIEYFEGMAKKPETLSV